MSVRIEGPALLLSPIDAVRVDRQLREAIQLGWLRRGLAPPYALLAFADQIHALANMVRVEPLVSGVYEHGSANMADGREALCHKEFLSVEQAALLMGVSQQHVRRLAAKGAVTAVRRGGTGPWAIDTAAALAWAAGRTAEAA